MAQILVGHDVTGGIRKFDRDGDLTAGQKLSQCFFLSFSRLLNKDEIKKGSFSIAFITGGLSKDIGVGKADDGHPLLTLQDHNAQNSYFVNSPAGEYGLLLSSSTANLDTALGLIYYQAGIAVITSSLFHQEMSEFPGSSIATNFGIGDGDNALSTSDATFAVFPKLIQLRTFLIHLEEEFQIFNLTTPLS